MQPRELDLRLADILDAAQKILANAGQLSADELRRDAWTLDAILHNLAVIGESAARLPNDFTARYPSIAWAEMSDMRNILVHEYFGVDVDLVWKTIQDDLPKLVEGISRILDDDG